jgi:hypothetical protein
VPAGFVQRALELGWRIGFTGGGDDHTAHPGDEVYHGVEPWRYKAGLMAVHAAENTRDALWQAMWNRRCYATTGARIILDWSLEGRPMGAELSLRDAPGLEHRRRLRVRVHGTAPVRSVEIVRNNRDVHRVEPGGMDTEFGWTDAAPLAEVNLAPAPYCPSPFTFYYVRVTQADGEMAWGSPAWIQS